jgi:transcriptional regulator with XRE-family HTH domain
MHERLRLELLRRIQRGTLSVSLLARQTGYGQPHLSNYLHGRRQLSLEAIDRILEAQHLTIVDLVASARRIEAEPRGSGAGKRGSVAVPLVSHQTAMFEPYVRASAVQGMIYLPVGALEGLRSRGLAGRRGWERFVAVRISAADALPMEPLVLPEAIALIDRHYDSLAAYRPNRANLYAVKNEGKMILRYADFLMGRLVLRPHNHACPVELIEVGDDETPRDLIAGRVALILNET